ncbi:hypothetical protein [Listeria booriae]|uniref:hypothetical protein n=1 Tax=Listeria booriae TaxID=1552123 RepID=UPI001628F1CB|nr:hypothetical protein [Listeria booriae]MBC2023297.1 hypothetical protein [Listeria booriae]
MSELDKMVFTHSNLKDPSVENPEDTERLRQAIEKKRQFEKEKAERTTDEK